MNKAKNFILKNVYKIFLLLFLFISIIFFIVIKSSIDNIINLKLDMDTEGNKLLIIIGMFIIIITILILGFVYILRIKILEFSDEMCEVIDKIIYHDEAINFELDDETLLSKLQHKFKKLMDIMENYKFQSKREKDNIKALIADISHQIKTPIANISMYNDTLIERKLNEHQQKIFLNNMRVQVRKLEWLVQSLIKMSRLESNVIKLTNKESFLSDTIANALSGVYLKAEEKEINLKVSCPHGIKLCHDKRWTSEALFNIIENAVKYTNNGGEIDIIIKNWELFIKVDIIDTGIGIKESEINNIFKRFYRAKEVSDIEGIGIGLYLANEIITKQGGYIKVISKENKGSIFSVFLKK